MKTINSEVLIIGAGAGGLSAAYWLLKNGFKVTIIEKELVVGGLMRSIKYEDFAVDFGYKHLYSRIPEVHKFWSDILGDDFLPYQSRIGILYNGHILEKERKFRGIRRGMPYGLLLSSFANMLKNNYRSNKNSITSLQDYTYSRRGEKFTRIFSQEYDERFKGLKWSQLPAPETLKRKGFLSDFLNDAVKITQKQEHWFHPSKGTGQIVENLEKEVLKMGGKIYLGFRVTNIYNQQEAIKSIEISNDNSKYELKTSNVISSLPLQIIATLMGIDFKPAKNELSFNRGIILVYLFLKQPTKFPHTSLHVSCPNTLMSRITNFSAYGGSMVPKGKGCLCIEYFSTNSIELFVKSDKEIFEFAINECEKSGLVNKMQCQDFLVIKAPNSDPAVSFDDYSTDPTRKKLYEQLSKFKNLYQINRTGTDKSTYAGIIAAKAIVNNDKHLFDYYTSPDIYAPWEK